MRTMVGRVYRFRGRHSLPDFPPPWCYLHEHDYTVEIAIPGDMPTDILDGRWAALSLKDGIDLNDYCEPSTVENIANSLLAAISEAIMVTVWEDKQRWGRAER